MATKNVATKRQPSKKPARKPTNRAPSKGNGAAKPEPRPTFGDPALEKAEELGTEETEGLGKYREYVRMRAEDAGILRREINTRVVAELDDADLLDLTFSLAGGQSGMTAIADACLTQTSSEVELVRQALELASQVERPDCGVYDAINVTLMGIQRRCESAAVLERRRLQAVAKVER